MVDSDGDEHSNMSICDSSSSSSSSSSSRTASGHCNGLSCGLGVVPHTALGVRHSKPVGIDEQQEMELFVGANENKSSSSSSSDVIDGMEIEKESENASIQSTSLDHCREWLLPSWADSAKASSTAIAGTSSSSSFLRSSCSVFPMVTLNRLGGVVGGRAVTIPEATLKW